MKNLLKDAKLGLYLSLAASVIAVVGSAAYLIIYMVTAGQTIDRVFSWLTFGLMLGGGIVGAVGEFLKLPFTPILAGGCFAVALANHTVEAAYPIADILTGVPFFGGNGPLAIAFIAVFALAAILNVVAAFMTHRK